MLKPPDPHSPALPPLETFRDGSHSPPTTTAASRKRGRRPGDGFLGRPPNEAADALDAYLAAQEAGIAAAMPGADTAH